VLRYPVFPKRYFWTYRNWDTNLYEEAQNLNLRISTHAVLQSIVQTFTHLEHLATTYCWPVIIGSRLCELADYNLLVHTGDW